MHLPGRAEGHFVGAPAKCLPNDRNGRTWDDITDIDLYLDDVEEGRLKEGYIVVNLTGHGAQLYCGKKARPGSSP